MDESLVLINKITLNLHIKYIMTVSCCGSLIALIPPLISRCNQEFTYVPQVKLFTFCEARGLSCVSQAEFALFPAAVVANKGVVGLLDVHIITDTEHVTGSLCA